MRIERKPDRWDRSELVTPTHGIPLTDRPPDLGSYTPPIIPRTG
jgi:hypothetical protein